MFVDFFLELRNASIPVSLSEYLTLMEAMDKGLAEYSLDEFYYLTRACLVKDESNIDKFDIIFGHTFRGLEAAKGEEGAVEVPEEWLRKMADKLLTDEEKAVIEALGGWDKLMETLEKRLAEQKQRHQGGAKWIGTAGASPFGAYGYNPEGIRIGQEESQNQSAVKVWDKREFKKLDGSVDIGTRNIKVALRRLRKFARQGAATELDLDGTINATAKKGYLDLHMVPQRHNSIKVLLFLDVGGSMDNHVRVVEEMFSAARVEFKHLEYFYFHNCLYDTVWRESGNYSSDCIKVLDLLHTYGSDYKVIFVGDASMSPYEIKRAGGAIDHLNKERGELWMQRLLNFYPNIVWLNPVKKQWWGHTVSIGMICELLENRMYPMTLEGLDRAIRELSR
jgi:uncharacterized protein with von Willebrand factor type A (vWA) domain